MASGTIYFGTDQYRCTISNLPLFYIFNIYILNIFKKLITTWTLLWKYYKNIVNIIFLLLFCYTYLNFQVPSTNKWLITPLFFHLHSSSFTFTIYLSLFLSWFYLLHMFTSTESYLISNFKKPVISLPLVRDISHHMGSKRKTQNFWEAVKT